ncbi:MAG: hypothetical protein AAGF99_05105 [Bacteroidota bacterium]
MSQVKGQGSEVELLWCKPGYNMIAAIKMIRAWTGVDLGQAKHAFDAFWPGGDPVCIQLASPKAAHEFAKALLTAGIVSRVDGTIYKWASQVSPFDSPREKGTFMLLSSNRDGASLCLGGAVTKGTADIGDEIACTSFGSSGMGGGGVLTLPVLQIWEEDGITAVHLKAENEEEAILVTSSLWLEIDYPILAPTDL